MTAISPMISVQTYLAGRTRRWHTHSDLNQTVADHSFGVALIISIMHPNPSANLLMAALFHDLGESLTGDIPSPAKARWPALKEAAEAAEKEALAELQLPEINLTKEECGWLKFADAYEALIFLECVYPSATADGQFDTRALTARVHECAAEIGMSLLERGLAAAEQYAAQQNAAGRKSEVRVS